MQAETIELSTAQEYYLNIQNHAFTTAESINPALAVPEPSQLQPLASITRDKTRYWIQITLLNRSNQTEWVLDTSNVIVNQLLVHSQSASRHQVTEQGYNKSWPFDLRYGAELELPVNEVSQLWIFISAEHGAVRPVLSIMPRKNYQDKSSSYSMQLLIAIGAIVMLALYQIVLFVPTRDMAYCWSALAHLAGALAWAAQCRALTYGFNVDTNSLWLYFPLFIAVALALQFSRNFLRIHYPHPAAYLLDILAVAIVVTGCAGLLFAPEYAYPQFLTKALLLGLLTMLGAGIWRTLQGFTAIRFYLLASLIMLLASIVYILDTWLELTIIENGVLVATRVQLIAMFIFMLALIDRVNLRQKSRLSLNNRSATDPITGLPNRSAFERDVRAWEAFCKEGIMPDFYLTFFDILSLRKINHLKGLKEGDRMLILIGKWLMEKIESKDVYRIGGDEYVVLTQKPVEWNLTPLMALLRKEGFKDIEIKIGTSCFSESNGRSSLLKLADDRLHLPRIE